MDFFSFKGFISNWLIANSTLIERPDSTIFRLDKIRYTLTPGCRYEFDQWLISGLLLPRAYQSPLSRYQKSRDQEIFSGSLYSGNRPLP